MKRITLMICAILTIATSFTAKAQTEAEMKKWMDYMTPGDVHKMIASSDGAWTGEVSTWMTPGAAPEKNAMTCTNKMIMGGRYQMSNYNGQFAGQPFEGMGLLSYDNAKKVFESIWVDNMGTGVMHLQGPWDQATNSITFTGKMTDPSTWKETTVKEVFKIIDADTQKMEMYAPLPDGKEFKTMEINFKRKK